MVGSIQKGRLTLISAKNMDLRLQENEALLMTSWDIHKLMDLVDAHKGAKHLAALA